jgi:hypothetical protein
MKKNKQKKKKKKEKRSKRNRFFVAKQISAIKQVLPIERSSLSYK